MKSRNPYLRLISKGQNVIISACKGGTYANIYNARAVFSGSINPDFGNAEINVSQIATEKLEVDIHEMYEKDAGLKIIFASLCSDLVSTYGYNLAKVGINDIKIALRKSNKIFESQEQIVKYALENERWLRMGGYGNFLLFTEIINGKEEVFVAHVGSYLGGLRIAKHLLSSNYQLSASNAHIIITPKKTD